MIEDLGARSDRSRGVIGILCPYAFPILVPAVRVLPHSSPATPWW